MALSNQHGAPANALTTKNSYVTYKRDTRYLLYWIINISNSVIKNHQRSDNDVPLPFDLNTSGQTTVAGLVAMAQIIAKSDRPVPSAIFSLLQSVVRARSAYYAEFQKFVSVYPDADIEKSNASHKHFIDALNKIFELLGGDAWLEKQREERKRREENSKLEDEENVFISNKFSALDLDLGEVNSNDESDTEHQLPVAAKSRTKKRKFGAKKSRREKMGKGFRSMPAKVDTSRNEVSIESYGILEADEDLMMDYLMAVCAFKSEWCEIRAFVQDTWQDVAHAGLNGAVAGGVSNMAVAKIKQAELEIFVDFPGHYSYEKIIQTLTRGDLDRVQRWYDDTLEALPENRRMKCRFDIKEQLLLHSYEALVDFITDFQKNRNGRPTKSMHTKIGNWDPHFDLRQATKEQRIQWRRSFTINWLYDLVNTFSHPVINHPKMRDKQDGIDRIDWSPDGPWSLKRRLFGLNEFAGVVTSLAMQKPGTDIRQKISPHHVFQLQCIIDATTSHLGMTVCEHGSHVLSSPAMNYRPARDIDTFLDRKGEMPSTGFVPAVENLIESLELVSRKYINPNTHEPSSQMLRLLKSEFINHLGVSHPTQNGNTMPSSRFASTNPNGLWDYSPFLCGVGLVEALQHAYSISMRIWDLLPEPILLFYLHDVLLEKKYIEKPIESICIIGNLFPEAIYTNTSISRSEITKSFKAWRNTRNYTQLRRRQKLVPGAVDMQAVIDVTKNHSFKIKSQLILHEKASWDPSRIPDGEIDPWSAIAAMRLGQTKHVVNPMTGTTTLEDTELVRRAKFMGGMSDEFLRNSSIYAKYAAQQSNLCRTMAKSKLLTQEPRSKKPKPKKGDQQVTLDDLEIGKMDFLSDICGFRPRSGINYLLLTANFLDTFMRMEVKLSGLDNPLLKRTLKPNLQWDLRNARADLTELALSGQDDECLRAMAETLQETPGLLMYYVYWDEIEDPLERQARKIGIELHKGINEQPCAVM
ncbi:hypothetical protein EsH8_IV_001293 [Colletotrichum jinshuiense]